MDGVLVIDKPSGPTSHDVVAAVKRMIGARRVGHLGTLDPRASGVLPLAVGGATKRAAELAGDEKTYEFTLCLGAETDTDDDGGRQIASCERPVPEAEDIRRVLPRFVGELMQVQLPYSAVKVGGRRAYQLARAGREFQLDPRTVRVDSLELLVEQPEGFRLRVSCGAGTYVRALCRDIGRELGCGGFAKNIRRFKSGSYIIDMATTLEALSRAPRAWQEHLLAI